MQRDADTGAATSGDQQVNPKGTIEAREAPRRHRGLGAEGARWRVLEFRPVGQDPAKA